MMDPGLRPAGMTAREGPLRRAIQVPMVLLRKGYRESVKRNMPHEWFDHIRHTHVALDDAIEQGALFCNMLAYRRGD
jgi:hypothetical protein